MRRRRSTWLAAFLVGVTLAGCDEGFPRRSFSTVPDTVSLFSLSRLEHIGLPSAYTFAAGVQFPQAVIVEAPDNTGQWDVAVVDEATGLALAPAGFFPAISVRPALARIAGETLESLERAPGDEDAYNDSTPELAAPGDLFVVRTRQVGRCVYFAKLEILEADDVDGSLTFHFIANPNCNDRVMVPPED